MTYFLESCVFGDTGKLFCMAVSILFAAGVSHAQSFPEASCPSENSNSIGGTTECTIPRSDTTAPSDAPPAPADQGTVIPGVPEELVAKLPNIPENNYGSWRDYEDRRRPSHCHRRYFEFDPRETPIPEDPILKRSIEIEPLMRRMDHEPQVGTVAPDFEAPLLARDADGQPVAEVTDKTFRLSDYRGKKPVVMLLYNCTCGGPRAASVAMAEMYPKYKDKVEFLYVTVMDHGYWHHLKEAYREGSGKPRYWHVPRDIQERAMQAIACTSDMADDRFEKDTGKVEYPIALDPMHNPVARLYRTAPPKMVAVDIDGRIAAKGWIQTGKAKNIIRRLAERGRLKGSRPNPAPEGDYPLGWHTDYGKTREAAVVAYLYFLHAEKRWVDAISLMAMMRNHFDDPAMIEYGAILLEQASEAIHDQHPPRQTVPASHLRLLRDCLSEQAGKIAKFPARKAVLSRLARIVPENDE